MGGCFSSPSAADGEDRSNRANSATAGRHGRGHHSSSGSPAAKPKTPDFGLGAAYQVTLESVCVCVLGGWVVGVPLQQRAGVCARGERHAG
jgi:hypothetical protein